MNLLLLLRGALALWLTACLLLPNPLSAQNPVLLIGDYTTDPGNTVEVAVRVQNYQQVAGTQFTLEWNPDLFSFSGIKDLNLGATLESNFGTQLTDAGKLTYRVMDGTLTGFTLDDNTALFTVELVAQGQPGAASAMTFTDVPTIRELSNGQGQEISATYTNGLLTVSGMTSALEGTITTGDWSASLSPNPTAGDSWIELTTTGGAKATVRVDDAAGREVYRFTTNLNTGTNRIKLATERFLTTGIYFINIDAGQRTVTRRLVRTQP